LLILAREIGQLKALQGGRYGKGVKMSMETLDPRWRFIALLIAMALASSTMFKIDF